MTTAAGYALFQVTYNLNIKYGDKIIVKNADTVKCITRPINISQPAVSAKSQNKIIGNEIRHTCMNSIS